MKVKREVQSQISLTLFVDDGNESKQAIEALKTISEPFKVYDIQSLNMAKGDEIAAPTLYAPEGIFRGWKEIQTFVRIPREMRYRPIVAQL